MKKTLSVLMMVLLSALLIISCNNSSKKVYTVTFDSNGGSKVDSVEVKEGEKVTKPTTDPTKDGYKFDKWTTDEAGTEEYDFDSGVTDNITLYAQWGDYYKVGDKGPAGGIVFYVNPDYEEGRTDAAKNWKYLEAAPAALTEQYKWGLDGTDYNTEEGVGKGKSNTEKLMTGTNKDSFAAAKACYDYEYTNTETGVKYDDWFLPSIGELNKMYEVKDKLDSVSVNSDLYWSSTGYGNEGKYAKERYFVTAASGTGDARSKVRFVWPVRSFSL